jgi:hypothetical protein
MIFISYSSTTTFFNSYDNDEKLLTVMKMSGSLTVFYTVTLVVALSSSPQIHRKN